MWLDSKAVNCPQKWGNFILLQLQGLLASEATRVCYPERYPGSENGRFSGVLESCKSFNINGGGNRIRTGDPLLAKQVLCQLSYTPTRAREVSILARAD